MGAAFYSLCEILQTEEYADIASVFDGEVGVRHSRQSKTP